MILRFRQADRDIFESIRSGRKRVETRAASKKDQDIKFGDEITLICGSDKFKRKVKEVRYFRSLDDLLRIYSVEDVAPSLSTVQELKKIYKSFPGYDEKIKKFGLVALEFAVSKMGKS